MVDLTSDITASDSRQFRRWFLLLFRPQPWFRHATFIMAGVIKSWKSIARNLVKLGIYSIYISEELSYITYVLSCNMIVFFYAPSLEALKISNAERKGFSRICQNRYENKLSVLLINVKYLWNSCTEICLF